MSLIITSPLRGWATTLDSVPDPVFAQRMMGDGVAIQPLGDTVVAPFDGEVVTLHDAGHAISLRSAEGAQERAPGRRPGELARDDILRMLR